MQMYPKRARLIPAENRKYRSQEGHSVPSGTMVVKVGSQIHSVMVLEVRFRYVQRDGEKVVLGQRKNCGRGETKKGWRTVAGMEEGR